MAFTSISVFFFFFLSNCLLPGEFKLPKDKSLFPCVHASISYLEEFLDQHILVAHLNNY